MGIRANLPVSIYALGGLGEVGKNMYCVENDETIVILDCGVRFPGIEFPGIDYIVPDFTHLKNNRNKIKALVITHGHEDHIGGIPFLLQHVNIPVIFAPKLAAALIKSRLEEQKLINRANIVEYDSDSIIDIDRFQISFFRVTHSIPDSFGIVVDTPEGRIVNTGDFKVDLTPVGPDMELTKIARLGKEGVTLLLSDSTNAEKEGYTPSERNVYESIEEVFKNANGRIIVSTFSSNISRIQQICECAVLHNRRITIIGRSMEKAVDISRNLGYIKIPDVFFIDSKDIKLYRNNEILILCTGSQGEPMAALSRIAAGGHKDVHIIPGDTVVFSSSPIPGNSLMIQNIVGQLTRCGADVITNSIISDIHSSGHPSRQELRLMLKLLNPKYFMPAHGEYRMLRLHAEIAQTLGIPKENCFLLDNGDVLNLLRGKVTRGYAFEHGNTYIDGKDINGQNKAVIEDRRILTNDGMIVITISIDIKSGKLLLPPSVLEKGFLVTHKKQTLKELEEIIYRTIGAKINEKTNFNELKLTIKNVTDEYVYAKTKRHPMIIPVVMSKN